MYTSPEFFGIIGTAVIQSEHPIHHLYKEVFMDSAKEMIEKRAYHLFLKRGGIHGYAMQDWMQAEKEIISELSAKKKAEAKQPAVAPAQPAQTAKPKAASPRAGRKGK